MRELLTELLSAIDAGRDVVLCSLVETRGSTPQKPGAAMLVFADGSQRGTLGGGCVEAEVKQRALRITDDQPHVQTFHLDDNYGWDDGLICGGRMTIVAQRLTPVSPRTAGELYFRQFQELVRAGTGCTEAVLLKELESTPAGARFLFDTAGDAVATLHAATLPALVSAQLQPVQNRPSAYHHEGIAYLPVLPRVTLLIVGGGHVGLAVAKLASETDFDVWVLDDREQFANRERFPHAQRLFVGDMAGQLAGLAPQLGPAHFAIIVTRGHSHDEEALYHLVNTQAGYVGMIGSKRKIKLIFDDLLAKGISRAALDRVHAPLGLDIGSQTVPEVAISIIAELIACRNRGERQRVAT